MISHEVTNFILSALDNETDKLSDISGSLNKLSFGDRLSSLTAVSLLLSNSLLDHKQQIIALWLLFGPPQVKNVKEHPFYQVLASVYKNSVSEPNLYSPQLQELIRYIFAGLPIDFLGSQSVSRIFSSEFSFPPHEGPNSIETSLLMFEARSNGCDSAKLPSLLLAKSDDDSGNNSNNRTADHSKVLLEILQENAFWNSFSAPLLILAPDVSPVFEGEIEAVSSFDSPPFIFDEGVTVDSREAAIALARKSTEAKLRSGETSSLIKKLEDDSSFIREIPLSSLRFLIENNKEVAKVVIKYYSKNEEPKRRGGSKKDNEKTITDILLSIELTASSIDVITHFITDCYASEDFLDKYIHYTTQAILKIRDNQTMVRKTRLFCRMMIFLIDDIKIKLSSIMILNLNSFCQDNRIKSISEAKSLDSALL